MRLCHTRDPVERLGAVDRARGVVGRVDQEAPRPAVAGGPRDVGGVGLKPVFGARGDRDGPAPTARIVPG
jgi:hypothetical protein